MNFSLLVLRKSSETKWQNDQTQIWQTLRDEAAYVRQAYENNEQREAQLIATAIGNESGAAKDSTTSTSALLQLIRNYGGI